jgi:hypothetical protein
MGLHNRSLQRAFNETLAQHPDTLAQKSAYFGPSDDIPAHWVEAGWENGLKAINEGTLQVPERIIPIPSLNSVLNIGEIGERFHPRCISLYPS